MLRCMSGCSNLPLPTVALSFLATSHPCIPRPYPARSPPSVADPTGGRSRPQWRVAPQLCWPSEAHAIRAAGGPSPHGVAGGAGDGGREPQRDTDAGFTLGAFQGRRCLLRTERLGLGGSNWKEGGFLECHCLRWECGMWEPQQCASADLMPGVHTAGPGSELQGGAVPEGRCDACANSSRPPFPSFLRSCAPRVCSPSSRAWTWPSAAVPPTAACLRCALHRGASCRRPRASAITAMQRPGAMTDRGGPGRVRLRQPAVPQLLLTGEQHRLSKCRVAELVRMARRPQARPTTAAAALAAGAAVVACQTAGQSRTRQAGTASQPQKQCRLARGPAQVQRLLANRVAAMRRLLPWARTRPHPLPPPIRLRPLAARAWARAPCWLRSACWSSCA